MADIVVIGAGVIGLSAAYYLVADGHHVTVLDRDPAGDKASFGNAGGIGISEIIPAFSRKPMFGYKWVFVNPTYQLSPSRSCRSVCL